MTVVAPPCCTLHSSFQQLSLLPRTEEPLRPHWGSCSPSPSLLLECDSGRTPYSRRVRAASAKARETQAANAVRAFSEHGESPQVSAALDWEELQRRTNSGAEASVSYGHDAGPRPNPFRTARQRTPEGAEKSTLRSESRRVNGHKAGTEDRQQKELGLGPSTGHDRKVVVEDSSRLRKRKRKGGEVKAAFDVANGTFVQETHTDRQLHSVGQRGQLLNLQDAPVSTTITKNRRSVNGRREEAQQNRQGYSAALENDGWVEERALQESRRSTALDFGLESGRVYEMQRSTSSKTRKERLRQRRASNEAIGATPALGARALPPAAPLQTPARPVGQGGLTDLVSDLPRSKTGMTGGQPARGNQAEAVAEVRKEQEGALEDHSRKDVAASQRLHPLRRDTRNQKEDRGRRRAPVLGSTDDVVLSRGADYSTKSAPQKEAQRVAGQRAVKQVAAALRQLSPDESSSDVLNLWIEQLRTIDLNQVIKELGKAGLWHRGLEVLDWMKGTGGDCLPNQITYVTLLTALGRAQEVGIAEQLFGDMRARGLKRNVIVFNAMMSVYVRSERPSQALSLFPLMSEEGVRPDFFSYATAINACSASPVWLPRGLALFEQMRREKIHPDAVVYNALMKACIKGGQPDEAVQIFGQMQLDRVKPTLLGFNTLLDAHAETGRWQEGFTLLEELRAAGFEPDLVTFNTLVKACCRAGKLREGLRVLEQIRASGLQPDVGTFTLLISGCADAGLCNEAAALYRESKREGIVFDSLLFAALIDASDSLLQVENYLQELGELGVSKSGPIYTALFRTYSRLGEVQRIKPALAEAGRHLSKLDVSVFNAAMEAYSKGGRVGDVVGTFNQLESDTCTADEVSYTILMDSLGKAGLLAPLVEALRRMQGAGLIVGEIQLSVLVNAFAKAGELERAAGVLEEMTSLGIEAGATPYNSLLAAAAREGLVESCLKTYRNMQRSGVRPTVETFSALIDAFGRSDRISEAKAVFQRITKVGLQPDLVAHTALITAYGRAGLGDEAIECFRRMQAAGLRGDLVAYSALMSGMHAERRDEELLVVFDEMVNAGVKPDRLALNYQVGAFCRLQRVGEAEVVVGQLWAQEAADVRSVNLLLNAYASEGEMDQARSVFQRMRAEGPAPDVVTYTLLVSALGRLRRFDEAAVLFEEMQRDGLDLRLDLATAEMLRSIVAKARRGS